MRILAACVSHQGLLRDKNEDNYYFDRRLKGENEKDSDGILFMDKCIGEPELMAIFDGMGGEARGEEASHLAADTLYRIQGESKLIDDNIDSYLQMICEQVNKNICDRHIQVRVKRMGTTAAMLCFAEGDAYLCNVGDSKIFHISNGKMEQCSVDHTNQKTLELMGITGKRPVLTQYLGMPLDEIRMTPYILKLSAKSGEQFLVCSDGLTDMVSTADIFDILNGKRRIDEKVDELLQQALSAGGRDNITIILVAIK